MNENVTLNTETVTLSTETVSVTITGHQAAALVLALWDSADYHEKEGRMATAQAARNLIDLIKPVTYLGQVVTA